ncbi:hypothetical protein GWK47_015731 [Chionoecetes opilio]|uniref:Uncharacterized protein n=1 Tax=Chionoecetes opilio TaxID=41210 RepID=A0A8J4XV34_CHIOP|nr:hypothetical protein GWK47_015731 [Chionoecetes opilio]
MAQYLQGLMEEGMGGVENASGSSGRVGRAAGPTCRHITTPRVIHQAPTSHQPLSSTLATTRHIAHHLLQDQGERPWASSPATFEAWAPSVEDSAASAVGRHP